MSSSTILLLVLGLALLGNTVVGGLPDKLIALGSSSTTPAKAAPGKAPALSSGTIFTGPATSGISSTPAVAGS